MMNREVPKQSQDDDNNNNADDASPRKAVGAGGGANGDRLKRDEWSEGAVSSLLEAYEGKWVLRNRAKLKGQDWEDVARHVSGRSGSSKSPKTQTQCKNKIESMKKRYRSESATGGEASSWPLYPRLDLLLRGSAASIQQPLPPPPPPPPPPPLAAANHPPFMFVADPPQQPRPPLSQPSPPPILAVPQNLPARENSAQNSHGSNGVDRAAKEDEGMELKLSNEQEISDKKVVDTDSSTPAALYSEHEHGKSKSKNNSTRERRKRRRSSNGVAESIRCVAEVVVRMEQARMEMMKEVERMRAEAELKRGEMDLKRTEIIANTQLEIAKLFAGVAKDVDSSFRIGRI